MVDLPVLRVVDHRARHLILGEFEPGGGEQRRVFESITNQPGKEEGHQSVVHIVGIEVHRHLTQTLEVHIQ